MELSRQEYLSGMPFPSPGDLPNLGKPIHFHNLTKSKKTKVICNGVICNTQKYHHTTANQWFLIDEKEYNKTKTSQSIQYPYSVQFSSVAQSYPTLCDPTDCSLLGFSAHGILQARILEWIAITFPRRSSQPSDQTLVSCISGRFFTIWGTGKSLQFDEFG